MKIATTLSLGLLLLLPAQAFAADFQGVFELEGTYSSRHKTAATLTVVKGSNGQLLVSRRGTFTAQARAGDPAFIWQSTDVTVDGSKMVVVYSLNEPEMSLIGGLRSSTSTRALAERLDEGNQFKAVYFLKNAGKEIREVVVNRTRKAPEDFWSYIGTQGSRKVSPQPGTGTGGSQSAFVKKAFKTINEAVQKRIKDHWEFVLDFADTPDEEQDAHDGWAEDKLIKFSRLEQVNPDEVMDDSLDWRYGQGNDPVKNQAGQVVPRDQLEVWQISLAGQLTDFEEHGWTFVFDKRNGELLISEEPEDL